MSNKNTFKTTYKIFYNLEDDIVFESTPNDTPETLKEGHAQFNSLIAQRRALLPPKPKLIGNRHIMSAAIELAMEKAINPQDRHSVWAALVLLAENASKELALGDNKTAPLMGLTDDGMIKYKGKNGKVEFFTEKQLISILDRQKPTSNSR